MLWVVRVAPFAVLLVIGGVVAWTRLKPSARAATNTLIAFVVGASCYAGVTQHDFWPFSPFPVTAESARQYRNAVWYEPVIADERGEHPLDASPLTASVLRKWIERRFVALQPAEQSTVARFLILSASRRCCRNDRILGALAAPDWLLSTHSSAAGQGQVLRVYRYDINRRTLAYEYRSE